MSRKIKDIKDKHTGELVYPRTHVSAVVLSSDSTLEDLVEVKQDKINDLDEIRAGAAKGATALQSVPSEYVTETELSNKGYATISALNNKVDVINGKQLSTEDFTTALKTKLEGLSNYDDTELSNALSTLRGDFNKLVSGDTTTAIKTFNEVIAFLDGLTDTQDLESIIANIEQQIAGKMDKVTLAKVATSGSYNDLSNKPTIPAAVTESTVSGWGFTKNTGTYSKPSGGIPKTDLASAVQTSLGKADTALQSYTEQYKGTITGVSANGTSVATSGVANIPAASTSKYGVTKLNSATNSTSTTEAATPSAVKAAYDLANGKQAKLVSGTNIKNVYTTNSDSSILGSGELHLASVIPGTSKVIATGIWNNYDVVEINTSGITFIPEEEGPATPRWSIHRSGDGTKFLADDGTYKTISSGGGSIDTSNLATKDELAQKQDVISDIDTIRTNAANYKGTVTSVKINGQSKSPSSGVVDLGYVNKQLSTTTSSSMTLSPNIYYRNTSTSLSSLTITLGSVSNSNILNEYFVEFTTRSSGTTVSLPSSIKWANGVTPTFENGKTYQISIVNNLGTCVKFG